jgi:hypothetical protein
MPHVNGLSDHDAQIICLNKLKPNSKQELSKVKMRLINDTTIKSFQLLLKDDMWYQVYASHGTSEAFNIFHDMCLKYFEASFPIIYKNKGYQQKSWITMDIKLSCDRKRDLFKQYRENTGNIHAKNQYKAQCNILKKTIKEAKKQFFHKQIAALTNKVKSTWRIITNTKGNSKHTDTIDSVKCGNILLNNPKDIANAFNNYYSNITSNLDINQINLGKEVFRYLTDRHRH